MRGLLKRILRPGASGESEAGEEAEPYFVAVPLSGSRKLEEMELRIPWTRFYWEQVGPDTWVNVLDARFKPVRDYVGIDGVESWWEYPTHTYLPEGSVYNNPPPIRLFPGDALAYDPGDISVYVHPGDTPWMRRPA